MVQEKDETTGQDRYQAGCTRRSRQTITLPSWHYCVTSVRQEKEREINDDKELYLKDLSPAVE